MLVVLLYGCDYAYTAKNATDLLQVVNYTGLLQLVNKLQQTCQFHQVATSLLRSSLLQLVICRLFVSANVVHNIALYLAALKEARY